ncbi:hypothetical protein AMS69_11345 [Haloarcula rubripromontorii]|uniref:Uncharacterized protein n=1 Tax=Haloarcula rubripromontorii TaxID=1705562 RepID=A0A0M9AJ00_9EURY|nr:hypothetical protein [Haloarcula rubripromontorii]KOX93037.1 hypothetical protein AMS69_11345 [Haloarcula rubripromontorii]
MPVTAIDWIDSVDEVETTTIGGETEVILYTEEEDPLTIRHRVSLSDFKKIFKSVFDTAESVESISADDFRHAADQNPDADVEIRRTDIGYDDVIDYWEEHDVFENESGGSLY